MGSPPSGFDSEGPFLTSQDGEQDGSHLKEFALPVLQSGLDEVARGEVDLEAHRLFVVLAPPAGQALSYEEDAKQTRLLVGCIATSAPVIRPVWSSPIRSVVARAGCGCDRHEWVGLR